VGRRGIAPQVVFEILSPGNRAGPMREKFEFYNRYRVEEYYIYDPDRVKLTGHRRSRGKLKRITKVNGWTSPLLGIRFDMSGPELTIYGPDGERFLTYQEIGEQRDRLARKLETERQRTERMAAMLRAMGLEPPE
jgi:Uma2 family endonuclease